MIARRRFSPFLQGVAALIIATLLHAPLVFLIPQVALSEPGAAGSNPTPEEIALLKADYEAYLKKSKRNGQERLGKILAAHQTNWEPVELIAPYWRESEGFSSTVVINNTFSRAVDVTLAIRTANGRELELHRVRIRANGSMDLRVGDLIGRERGHGQIALKYTGEPQELNAVIVIANRERSLSVDHPFESKGDFSTSTLDGVFYLPEFSTRPEIALSNTSDKTLRVSLAVRPEDAAEAATNEVEVGPNQTEIVNVRPLLRGGNGRAPLAARVRLEHTGEPGDVRVHGMLMDANGFSANMRFLEAAAMTGNKLFSPILPLREPVRPIVLLANTNKDPVTVRLEAYYALNDELEERTLRVVRVPAGEAVHVDVAQDLEALPQGASNVGLVLHYYAGGGLLTDVLLIDRSGSGVYQVSPKGYASHSHTSHSFPVRLDGDLRTIITVANPSETEDLTYSLNLFFNGKSYLYAGTSLAPGETRNIDVKALRDKQVPGGHKELLALAAATGQAALHFRPRERQSAGAHAGHTSEPIGIASAVTFDETGKMSFVTCWPQCPPEFYDGEVTQNGYWEGVLDEGSYTIELTFYDAGGSSVLANGEDLNWSSTGYPVISAEGLGAALQQVGTTDAYANVNLWPSYCYNGIGQAACGCGESWPVLEIGIAAGVYQNHQVTLTATGTQEDGKATHFLSLTGSGDVEIYATVTPNNPGAVSWTGGSAGADNGQRLVSKSSASNPTVTATVSGGSASVVIHVVEATAPPAAADAPKGPSLDPTPVTPLGFGITLYSIGSFGIVRPSFNVDGHLDGNRWVFRLVNVSHTYKQGVFTAAQLNKIELSTGNQSPFPQVAGMDLTQSHTQARSDYDTTGLIHAGTSGGTVGGPPLVKYYTEAIIQHHEDAHVLRFYGTALWINRMELFESEDVEATSVFVTFDCNTPATMTVTGAVNLKKGDPSTQNPTGWYANIESRHNNADTADHSGNGDEAYAHGISNVEFAALRSAIPNP